MDGVAVEAPRCLGRIARMDGVVAEAPRCLGRIARMDGVAVEAPRSLGRIARMDGVAVEASRLKTWVLSGAEQSWVRFVSPRARRRAKRGTDNLTH